MVVKKFLFNGVRNTPVSFRTTITFKKALAEARKTLTKPNPNNPKYHVHFKSERDMIETLVAAAMRMSPTMYTFWIEFFNPNHPEDRV